VLADFSGYIAVDELYDGPFCVLSIVDNRCFHRLIYEVLDHNPACDDIRRFFRRFSAILKTRGLALRGITTDGSELYPAPMGEIFAGIKHQLCEFHLLKKLTKSVLDSVAKVRKKMAASEPKLPRGRPMTKRTKKTARCVQRLREKRKALYDRRHLFVKHRLTPAERRTFARITRGAKELRALRAIMDEVYRLFDRRCRTDTALGKLARLRRRIRRFGDLSKTLRRLFSPNVEKALTFLDDRLLPATSNAVERGNRRHRKMQKSIYRVRTREHIEQRIALDMLRDDPAGRRTMTITTLHRARAG
jgi:hypothetical protein